MSWFKDLGSGRSSKQAGSTSLLVWGDVKRTPRSGEEIKKTWSQTCERVDI